MRVFVLKACLRLVLLFANVFAFFIRRHAGLSKEEWEERAHNISSEEIARVIAEARDSQRTQNSKKVERRI